MTVVGTMLLAFGNGGVSYAERTLPSGLAALLVASVPLWMTLADRVINGRRLRPGGWAALVIGLTGTTILARPHGHGTVLPILVVLGAGASWGIGSVLAGRLPAPVSPLLGSYVIALRRLPTSAVSTYAYVNPVVAVALGALILGERLTLTTLLGVVIVIASVAAFPRKRLTQLRPHPGELLGNESQPGPFGKCRVCRLPCVRLAAEATSPLTVTALEVLS